MTRSRTETGRPPGDSPAQAAAFGSAGAGRDTPKRGNEAGPARLEAAGENHDPAAGPAGLRKDRPFERLGGGAFLVRLGVGFVFVALGADKVASPAGWTTFIPPDVQRSLEDRAIAPADLMWALGFAEAILGLHLLIGLFTRIAAAATVLVLAAVIAALGWGGLAIRDLGLLLCALAVVVHGGGPWSLDRLLAGAGRPSEEPLGERPTLGLVTGPKPDEGDEGAHEGAAFGRTSRDPARPGRVPR
jgi:uncharacterized membrane protein YphA (DoxX/SURF4 family)